MDYDDDDDIDMDVGVSKTQSIMPYSSISLNPPKFTSAPVLPFICPSQKIKKITPVIA